MKSNGFWWNSWDFKNKILWNPMGSDEIHGVLGQMESYGFHEILTLKSFQISSSLKSINP